VPIQLIVKYTSIAHERMDVISKFVQ